MAAMAEVQKLQNTRRDLGVFFDTMFGTQSGYVYAPTKLYAADPRWDVHFFQWPREKEKLLDHVEEKTPTHEVYYAPILLHGKDVPKRDKPENFAGSYWVWCEFDYGIPKPEKLIEYRVPQPQVRIRTSEPGHEHWYWRIGTWQEDPEALREVTQRLAYAFNADTCFDWGRVLRVPYTIHHDTKMSVQLLYAGAGRNSYQAFDNVPQVERKQLEDVDLGPIPEVNKTLWRHRLDETTIEILSRTKDELAPKDGKPGRRSTTLLRLAHQCAEIGMTNEEIYSILQNRDDYWGKYSELRNVPKGKTPPHKGRQQKELVKIINIVRKKHPYTLPEDLTIDFPVMGFMDLLATEEHIEWIIPGLIHKNGLWMITGASQSGKSQLVIWMLMHIAIGKPMLGGKWSAGAPQKVIFFSGEMNRIEVKEIGMEMVKHFTSEEQQLINENFRIIPLGYAVQLDKRKNQDIVNAIMDKHQPTGIVFDSFGMSIGDNMNDAEPINNMFNYLKKDLNVDRNCHVGFIHHNVKAQIGNRKPNKISDIYGSAYIVNNVRTIVGLWRTGNNAFSDIEVDCLKLTLAPNFKGFRIKRTDPLGFELVGDGTEAEITDEEIEMATNFDVDDKKGKDDRGFEI